MPIRSDDPLRKVTLNLYAADVEWLEKAYGHGWTERVRQHIHQEVTYRQLSNPKTYRHATLGDLPHDT